MRKVRKTIPDRQSEDFAIFWHEDIGRYCLALEEDMPELNISTDSLIYAQGLTPQKGDLIVYAVPGQPGRVMVGRFIRSDESLVAFTTGSGLVNRIYCVALLVITYIA